MSNAAPLATDEARALEYVKGLRDFYTHVFIYLTLLVTFAIAFGPTNPLVMWGGIGWGAGLIVHGLTAYEVITFLSPDWERKQIEKRLGRPL